LVGGDRRPAPYNPEGICAGFNSCIAHSFTRFFGLLFCPFVEFLIQ